MGTSEEQIGHFDKELGDLRYEIHQKEQARRDLETRLTKIDPVALPHEAERLRSLIGRIDADLSIARARKPYLEKRIKEGLNELDNEREFEKPKIKKKR
ncbi:hypothetical protein ACFKHW_32010 [Bradyrhizobium lupini]|uniref:hypothetical protein n=1 Tax=Rhizobium lupini TaxID=136996 RepID=UPI00367246FC